MLLFFVFNLFTLTVSENEANLSSCKLLRDPIKLLKCEVEELRNMNHKLELSIEEVVASNQQLKISIERGETSDHVQNLILRKTSKMTAGLSSRCNQNACGPCACYTDYQLKKKYYCNCEHLEPMRDCLAFRNAGYNNSGLYIVHMNKIKTVEVFCDQETDGGGWTVFQRRINGNTNFYRDWRSYKEGFGNPQREFWLGNDNLYMLTYQAEYPSGSELRVDLEDFFHRKYSAKYKTFSIYNELKKYELLVNGFSGDGKIGDALGYHNGRKFSTYDADHDSNGANCARNYHGAWWYGSCHNSNLNGEYQWFDQSAKTPGVVYKDRSNSWMSLKFAEMKVRRKE